MAYRLASMWPQEEDPRTPNPTERVVTIGGHFVVSPLKGGTRVQNGGIALTTPHNSLQMNPQSRPHLPPPPHGHWNYLSHSRFSWLLELLESQSVFLVKKCTHAKDQKGTFSSDSAFYPL